MLQNYVYRYIHKYRITNMQMQKLNNNRGLSCKQTIGNPKNKFQLATII